MIYWLEGYVPVAYGDDMCFHPFAKNSITPHSGAGKLNQIHESQGYHWFVESQTEILYSRCDRASHFLEWCMSLFMNADGWVFFFGRAFCALATAPRNVFVNLSRCWLVQLPHAPKAVEFV